MSQSGAGVQESAIKTGRRRGRLLKGLRGCLVSLVVLGVLIGTILLWIEWRGWREMPEVRGVVLDAQTGLPLSGALVERQLYGPPPFDLVDTRTELAIDRGWTETYSDASGRFVLPGMKAHRLVAMAWLVWAPGYMPGAGCYSQKGWYQGSCPHMTGFRFPSDPWVQAVLTPKDTYIEMEVRLFSPTLEGVTFLRWKPDYKEVEPYTPRVGEEDPWGEYFHRLTIVPGWLPLSTAAEEFVRFVNSGRTMTPGMVVPLTDLVSAVPAKGMPDEVSSRRCLILRSLQAHWALRDANEWCAVPSVKNRLWLARGRLHDLGRTSMTRYLAVALAVSVVAGAPSSTYEWRSHNRMAVEARRLALRLADDSRRNWRTFLNQVYGVSPRGEDLFALTPERATSATSGRTRARRPTRTTPRVGSPIPGAAPSRSGLAASGAPSITSRRCSHCPCPRRMRQTTPDATSTWP